MRPVLRTLSHAAAAWVLLNSAAEAQVLPRLQVGSRVRVMVTGGDGWFPAGRVVSLSADGLAMVRDDSTLPPLLFRRAEISRLDMVVGLHHHARAGLAIGLLGGVATGALIGIATGPGDCTPTTFTLGGAQIRGANALLSAGHASVLRSTAPPFCPVIQISQTPIIAGLMGVVGGVVGTIAGAMYESETWATVPSASTLGALKRGNARLGLSIHL